MLESLFQVVAANTSITGKHGHSKIHFVGIDLFTSKKYENIIPSAQNVEIPIVTKCHYDLLNISSDGYCSLLKSDGVVREDLKIPQSSQLASRILISFQKDIPIKVIVQSAMGTDQIIDMLLD